MINNFESLGILGSLERIANDAQQSQNNDRDLLREMSEFGKGDYQIDKFGGLSMHPGAGNYDNTIVNALMSYC